ncbi:MAG: hypothetical protein IKQ10_05440 [Oscillospiraceae bacterium]|nr:hypothetical protein [Oscillospiraceae bacterium]
MYKIENVETLTLGTTAQTVKVMGLSCLIENNDDSATVYFKERRFDGKAVTTSNGWALGPGKSTPVPVSVMELSLISDTASADVRVLLLDEY